MHFGTPPCILQLQSSFDESVECTFTTSVLPMEKGEVENPIGLRDDHY